MNEHPVTVTILERKYRLNIGTQDEPYLHKAAALINEQARLYGQHYSHHDCQDLLAMVALSQTTDLTKLQANSQDSHTDLLTKLTDLDKTLEQYLHPTRNSL